MLGRKSASALRAIVLDLLLDQAIMFDVPDVSRMTRVHPICDVESVLFANDASMYKNKCAL